MSIVHDTLSWLQGGLQSVGAGIAVRFHEEPVIANAFLRAFVVLGTAFFLDWDETQVGAVYIFVEALTTFISRQDSTPNVRVTSTVDEVPDPYVE